MKVSTFLTIASLLLSISCWNPVLAKTNQKAKVRMNLEYLNTGEDERYLTVRVRTRIEKRYQPVEGLAINLYLIEPTESGLMGSVITDANGAGTLLLPTKFYLALDTLDEFSFIASLEDNPDYVDKEIALTITEVFLDLSFIDQDSVKLIRATVKEKDSLGTRLPREEVEIKFLVERPFSQLPIGGDYNTIDEEGQVTIEFPTDLPGDSAGNINIIVKIDESDLYGSVEEKNTTNWGLPTIFNDDSTRRSLWSAGANAPISLLLMVNSLIAAVWGILIFVVYRIYQIRQA